MNRKAGSERSANVGAASVALFVCLFAAQAAVIAMAPVLAEAASDLDVSTAAAEQLRTISGLAAGITALAIGLVAGRVGVGRQLPQRRALLAVASIASAAAPTFVLLALAQVPVGVAVAVLTGAGTLAGCGMGAARAAHAHAVLGARRPAGGLDRRDAAGRRPRRAQLAIRVARSSARGGGRGGILVLPRAEAGACARAPCAPSCRSRRPRPREVACVRAARERRRGRGRSCSPARSSPSRTERARG